MNDRERLPMWVVYDHPRDYPDSFVARRWLTDQPTQAIIVDTTLDEVRRRIQRAMPGAVRLARFLNDDPKIVEVWL